jgi:two-component system response regulator HydG
MSTVDQNNPFAAFTGHAPVLDAVIRSAQMVAATDVPVLIEGETGTGKELMARAIHQSSARASAPFIVINCAALPADIVESILFGHVAGAFTGAIANKEGYVQRAHGGTLFLDEIGELPLNMQAKLLRFVEHGECQRVGSHDNEKVDVRILAATHRNLMEMIKTGEFRQDLFYRLSVVTLTLPSLHQRRGDIPLLAEHFLAEIAERNHNPPCSFTGEALRQLKQYSWPGNIRELKNVCEHVSALMPGEHIDRENLPLDIVERRPGSTTGYTLPEHGIDMESLEKDLIMQALAYTAGNKSRAAKLLGLSRDAFLYRLKKHHL